jgi:Predicted acyl-CoA transferases/carnitine dehydratase
MFGPVETADGYVMLAIASEKTFQSLIKVIGHPEWIADPRLRYTPTAARTGLH